MHPRSGHFFNETRPHLIKLLIDLRFYFGHSGPGMSLALLPYRLKGVLTFLLPALFQALCIHDIASIPFVSISLNHFILPF
jgi:hypothetical protein